MVKNKTDFRDRGRSPERALTDTNPFEHTRINKVAHNIIAVLFGQKKDHPSAVLSYFQEVSNVNKYFDMTLVPSSQSSNGMCTLPQLYTLELRLVDDDINEYWNGTKDQHKFNISSNNWIIILLGRVYMPETREKPSACPAHVRREIKR